MKEMEFQYRKDFLHKAITVGAYAVMLVVLVVVVLVTGVRGMVSMPLRIGIALGGSLLWLATSEGLASLLTRALCKGKGVARLYEDRVELLQDGKKSTFAYEALSLAGAEDAAAEQAPKKARGSEAPSLLLKSGGRQVKITGLAKDSSVKALTSELKERLPEKAEGAA